jgi:hypothetical protein
VKSKAIIIVVAAWLAPCHARGAEYYLSPLGSDSNNGSIDAPFLTFSKGISTAAPGDTIWARGGTYNISTNVSISGSKDGTAANPYKLFAYPGEAPVLDFRGQPYSASNNGLKGITLNGDWWHIKGLTLQYAADNGMAIGGSNNIVEQVVARQNQDSGFQISGSSRPSNNLLLNCDSYGNFDFGAAGENADGFAVKFRELGPGNVIRGARAYNNGDDGFDFWQAENRITVENSWAFHNGIASVFNFTSGYNGDGNGIKLGHDSGPHVLENMLVWGHPAHGVDVNGNATQLEGDPPTIAHGVQIYNVTAANNGGRNFMFDENPTTGSPPTTHVLRNNVSFSGSVTIHAGNTTSHNTFAGPGGSPTGLGATAADFVSTVNPLTANGSYHPAGTGGDRSGATTPSYGSGPAVAPRLSDGSLPPLDFLRLAGGSDLIDAGTDVGLPFHGTAPDVGYYETTPSIVYAAADFNHDTNVDDADLAIWAANFGLDAGALPSQGDADSDGAVTGNDFLVWQQLLDVASASPVVVSVAEPVSWRLAAFVGGLASLQRRISRGAVT